MKGFLPYWLSLILGLQQKRDAPATLMGPLRCHMNLPELYQKESPLEEVIEESES